MAPEPISPRHRVEETAGNRGFYDVLVDDKNLNSLDVRPSLGTYLTQLWERRHFIWLDARSRAFSTERDLRLGRAWLILQPLLDAAFYGLMFGVVLRTARGIENFPGFVVVGITFFGIINGLFSQGSGLLRGSRGMISAFHFPKASLVFAAMLRRVLDSIPNIMVAIIVTLVGQWGEPIKPTIFAVIPLLILAVLFGTGLMFITARLTALWPDSRVIISFVSRAWFFLSGIFFDVTRYAETSKMHFVMGNNPGYLFLDAFRGAIMRGQWPDWHTWTVLSAWAFGAFILGFLFFWRAEERYINVVFD